MKTPVLAVVLALAVALSGCIEMSYVQNFAPDGSSTLTYSMDFAKLMALSTQMGNYSSDTVLGSESEGSRFYWSTAITYVDSQSQLSHTDPGLILRGVLSKTVGSRPVTNSCSGYGLFSCVEGQLDAQEPQIGGKLRFNVSNGVGRAVTITDVSVSGDNAPSDCTFTPAELQADGILAIECAGITAPSASPTPTPNPTPDPAAQMEASLNGMCANITAKDADLECSREGTKILVTKKLANGDGYAFSASDGFPNKKYRVEVESLPTFSASDSQEGSGIAGGAAGVLSGKSIAFEDAKMAASAAMLDTAGVKITYVAKMPGKITAAEGGQIKDGKAEFDVVALLKDSQNPVIESEELNTPLVAAAGIAVLVLLGLIAFFVLRRKPPVQPPAPAFPESHDAPSAPAQGMSY